MLWGAKGEQPFDEPLKHTSEPYIDKTQSNADGSGDDDDQDSQPGGLLSGWPGDLLELPDHLTEKLDKTTTGSGLSGRGATKDSTPGRTGHSYRTSRCVRCSRHRGQNLFSSSRLGSLCRFLVEVYVRSRHSEQAKVTMIPAPPFFLAIIILGKDLGDHPRPNRSSSLADGEAEPTLQGNGVDQLDLHIDVIAGHHHLHTLR